MYSHMQGSAFSLSCPTTENVEIDGTDFTRMTCMIGNPLPGPGVTLRVSTTLIPRPSLMGNEGTIPLMFSVTSVNTEIDTGADNMAEGQLMVRAVADVFLDNPG